MSRQGAKAPAIRRRLVRAAAATAAALALTSLIAVARDSADYAGSDAVPDDDSGIVLAAKVAARSTATEVVINVSAPAGQPPGVVYTVSRQTSHGETTVCTGPAPLRCTDPVGRPDTAVSYTVSSTLDGRETATTAVDTATAHRPRHAPSVTGAAVPHPGRSGAADPDGASAVSNRSRPGKLPAGRTASTPPSARTMTSAPSRTPTGVPTTPSPGSTLGTAPPTPPATGTSGSPGAGPTATPSGTSGALAPATPSP